MEPLASDNKMAVPVALTHGKITVNTGYQSLIEPQLGGGGGGGVGVEGIRCFDHPMISSLVILSENGLLPYLFQNVKYSVRDN